MAADPCADAQTLYDSGHYAEAVERLRAMAGGDAAPPRAMVLLARSLANQGKLPEALVWADRLLVAEKLNPLAHYLHATILQERGEVGGAVRDLQRAVYLDQDFVLAHFALGHLARGSHREREAERHFATAAQLLRGHRQDEILPESDGITAGRLAEIIDAMRDETTAA